MGDGDSNEESLNLESLHTDITTLRRNIYGIDFDDMDIVRTLPMLDSNIYQIDSNIIDINLIFF